MDKIIIEWYLNYNLLHYFKIYDILPYQLSYPPLEVSLQQMGKYAAFATCQTIHWVCNLFSDHWTYLNQ